MASTAQRVLKQVLEKGGFSQGGRWSSGLIDAEKARNNISADLRYGHLFQSEDGPIIDLVYEIPNQIDNLPGTSSVYFKLLEEPSRQAIIKLRSLVWNQGRSPTLWIVTSDSVLIYDSYARPFEGEDEKSHLLAELEEISGQINFLNEFHKRNFDTGDFWQNRFGKRIKQQQRVDAAMLNDLVSTERALIHEFIQSAHEYPLSTYVSIAHALLGRVIFVSYLEDRGLLDISFFQRDYNCDSFKSLLKDKTATYVFFGWLRKTFNGDLFPFQEHEQSLVDNQQLQVIRDFLSGFDMSSYSSSPDTILQKRLWPYKFDFIPIELISSIYEMFAHLRDSSAAEARSTHYTQFSLVELVLNIAMRDMPHTAKVLDPACGSGIFLVEAFRSLVWKRAREQGQLKRDELHDMLRSQIFGVDIDSDAVHVTAFSLYLTLLELDPDPQPLSALKFPSLLSAGTLVPNLYIQDFCNIEHAFNHNEPFVSKGFDIIIGNPPWTALKQKDAPRDPDNPQSGPQWGLQYCKDHDIPDNKPDQAFMIRATDFARPGTRIAFIVCSRLFYQQQDPRWLETYLSNNTIETVVNLSDFVGERVLFGGSSKSSTQLPASMVMFRAIAPAPDHKVMYITPKWYLNADKQDEILITAGDINDLSQKLLGSQPFLWKSAFRGTARDYRLLSKLQNLPSLKDVLSVAGVLELAHRGVIFGRGRQHDASLLEGKPFLASGQMRRYGINVETLGLFSRPTAERRYDQFLQLPALVFSRSLHDERAVTAVVEASTTREHLVIDQMYYGVPDSASYPLLVYQLNAILNSNIAFYMAFMFSSALGWDRRLIEEGDWQRVRLPRSIFDPAMAPVWQEVLRHERWLREHWQPELPAEAVLAHEVSHRQRNLETAISQLYELSDQEILMIEDTIQYGINPVLNKTLRVKNALARATTDDVQQYARRMCKQLNGLLRFGNTELHAIIVEFNQSLQYPLRACRFVRKIRDEDSEVLKVVQLGDIDHVINQMKEDLRVEIADHVYVQRSLRVYEPDGFWIIKSSQKRLWSQSAALNDADTIIREHMEVETMIER